MIAYQCLQRRAEGSRNDDPRAFLDRIIRLANRPRGLCWACSYTPGVRERFPPTGKAGRRGVGNGYRRKKLPARATAAPQGRPTRSP